MDEWKHSAGNDEICDEGQEHKSKRWETANRGTLVSVNETSTYRPLRHLSHLAAAAAI